MDPLSLLALGTLALVALGLKKPSGAAPPASSSAGSQGSGAGQLGAASAGAAIGMAAAGELNKLLFKTQEYYSQQTKDVYGTARAVTTIGFGVAGALIALGNPVGLVVLGAVAGVIAVLFLVHVLANPIAVPAFGDHARDRALSAYETVRETVYAEARQRLHVYTDLTVAERELLAASFADGLMRTQEAIGVEALRKAGASSADVEHQRLVNGGFAGLELTWRFSELPAATRTALNAHLSSGKAVQYGGAYAVAVNVQAPVAPTDAGLGRTREPAHRTLVEQISRAHPSEQTRCVTERRVGLAWRKADLQTPHRWTYVPEVFYATPRGIAMYEAGAKVAWGLSYVAWMRARVLPKLATEPTAKVPQLLQDALKAGKAAGFVHPAAGPEVLELGGVTWAWRDYQTPQELPA